MREKKFSINQIPVYFILILVAITTIYPVFFIIITSFKDKYEYMTNMFGFPEVWKTNNFQAIFKSFNIPKLMSNSFFVSSVAVIFSLIINSMAAFSLTKLKYKGQKLIFRIILFVLMVPSQALMIPVYLIISKLNLINNLLSVILVYVSTSIAFSTYLLSQNCKDIPDEIIEACRVDGASYPKIYWAIVLPMLRPVISTLAILNFLGFWNEIVYTRLLLQKTELHTLTLGLLTLNTKYGTNIPLTMAGLLISMIPALIIFFVFGKYLSQGTTMGSGK